MKLIDVDRAEMELTNQDRDICDQKIPSEQPSVVHGKWDVNFDGDNIVLQSMLHPARYENAVLFKLRCNNGRRRQAIRSEYPEGNWTARWYTEAHHTKS